MTERRRGPGRPRKWPNRAEGDRARRLKRKADAALAAAVATEAADRAAEQEQWEAWCKLLFVSRCPRCAVSQADGQAAPFLDFILPPGTDTGKRPRRAQCERCRRWWRLDCWALKVEGLDEWKRKRHWRPSRRRLPPIADAPA